MSLRDTVRILTWTLRATSSPEVSVRTLAGGYKAFRHWALEAWALARPVGPAACWTQEGIR